MGYTVLVTGASTPAGRSMIEALSSAEVRLLACDNRLETLSDAPVKQVFKVHASDNPEFVGDLVTLCVMHDVDVVVPALAADQLALIPVRKLFEGLGAEVWLAPIPEVATRSQARRILQIVERGRSRGAMTAWLRKLSNLGREQSHGLV
ncbi:MAG TPA: hypothetical protein VJV78_32890 [Polyangiales bacterium]|nr:hypothetical protein [Polyangiales bacterium]